jgi:hypothetical protein
MAINKNHPFEDIEGVKCSVVETGVSEERKDFIKNLLEFNGYSVVVSAEPVKAKPVVPESAPSQPNDSETKPIPEPALPTLYKIGVTDVTFNTTNAIFGRLLKTPDQRIVTQAYWMQKEKVSRDDIPYFESGSSI